MPLRYAKSKNTSKYFGQGLRAIYERIEEADEDEEEERD